MVMLMTHTAVILLLAITASYALDNGLGRTPQMAWNSWNHFDCYINETVIKETAEAFVKNGLNKFGYEYVNMDDCWAKSRNASGFIEPDPVAFPSGIKALADYVHSLGLKFGLYSDAGTETCAGRPGSLGYETQDAEQYAAWGVDYLKYDNCNNQGLPDPKRYATMRDALNKTGRPIFFSLCDWAITTAPWGVYTGNSWRTTTDIQSYWESWTNNLDQSNVDAPFAAPGGWNDPDMLEVGNGQLTSNENMAHFSLWALVKAPLVLGNDIRSLGTDVLEVITNIEVIQVSQDPLGVQGVKLSYSQAQDNTTTAAIVYATTCNGSPAQQFKYSSNGQISSVLTGGCLGQFNPVWACGYAGASMGAALYLQGCGEACSGHTQKYSFSDGGFQTSYTYGSPLCVTADPLTDSVSSVMLWNCSGADSQQWNYKNGIIQNGNQCLTVSGGAEVWAGKLSGGSVAVGLFNRASVSQSVSVSFTDVGISGAATVRDLWAHQDMGQFASSYSATVGPRGIAFLKVTPTN